MPESPELILCNCSKTMDIDAETIADALGKETTGPVYTNLCTDQQDDLNAIIERADSPVMIACTQFSTLFETLAEDLGKPAPTSFDIRHAAGWSEEGKKAAPKMAALAALAENPLPQGRLLSLTSHGRCLIYGGGEKGFALGKQLAETLGVTVMLAPEDEAPAAESISFTLARGRINAASGHFSRFSLTIDQFATALPHSRDEMLFSPAADGVETECDLLIDLTGGTPLFTGWQKRDGYFRADADDLVKIAEIEAQAQEMLGDFEKPIYINFDENLCAHSRNSINGCSRCIDACPAGAIMAMGDHVSIDPGICGGCGHCAAVCPSGAAQSGFPAADDVINRINLLASTYFKAGGKKPALLVHDGGHGRDVITSLARYSKGLPAQVIPMEWHAAGRFGHDMILGAIASGFERVMVITHPQRIDEAETLHSQAELAGAMLSGIGINPENRVVIIDDMDPDAIEQKLWAAAPSGTVKSRDFMALGAPRAITRLAMDALARAHKTKDEVIPLPEGSPYGRVAIDTENCTICLSCVGACPAGALQDNPDAPQLLFREDACLQCGICVATCPEKVIALEPQFNLADSARATELIIEDEPFHCEECGKAFGTTRSIGAIIEKLSGHAMFTDTGRLDMLKLCEDCRVSAIFSEDDSVADVGPRRLPRTTDDYLN